MKQDSGWYRPYIGPWQRPNIKDRKEVNVHHIYPTSRLGANIDENKIELYRDLHDSRHRLNGNGTPIECLRQSMAIMKRVFTNEFQKEMRDLLQQAENQKEYVYKDGIYLPNK